MPGLEDLQQANGIQHNQHKRKLVLRLDDGSLIGPVETLLGTASHGGPGAVLLDFEAACRTGRAGKNELDRLDRLIQDFQARVSGFHSIPRNELKQRNPYTQDVQRAIKRQRSLAGGELPPFSADPQLPQQLQQPLQPQMQQQQAPTSYEFIPKCYDVLNRVYAACNQSPPIFGMSVKDVFYRPVSETFPNIAGEYYRVVTSPMTFGIIEDRIGRRVYNNAQMFADDMRLLFANCKKFNPLPSDPVRMACLKLSEVFENSWVSSGLCAEVQRAKRATAGIAAPKFEPDEYDAAAQPPKTNSHRSGEQPPRRMPDGINRLTSHEVSSYVEEEVEQQGIPEDILQEVATQLQELGPDNLQVALGKFNEGVVTYDADGEVELDLEKVDYVSLMEVDAYIRQVNGLPPREAAPAGGGVRGGAAAEGAAAAAPSASDDQAAGAAGSGRRPKSGVRAEQEEDDDYYEEDDSDDDD